MKLRDFSNHSERNKALANELKVDLGAINQSFIDDTEKVHCENLIGSITLPIGVAGPIKIKGDRVDNSFYIPLATSEGALVASASRGCKAVSLSGGTNVYAYRVGTTRGPVFFILDRSRKIKSCLVG